MNELDDKLLTYLLIILTKLLREAIEALPCIFYVKDARYKPPSLSRLTAYLTVLYGKYVSFSISLKVIVPLFSSVLKTNFTLGGYSLSRSVKGSLFEIASTIIPFMVFTK